MLKEQAADQLLLIRTHLGQLPPDYSKWLDLQSPLPEDTYFAPIKTNWAILVLGFVQGTILLGFLFYAASYIIEDVVRGISWVAIAFIILFGWLFLAYALKGFLRFWHQVTVLYTQKKGHLRQGVFLGSGSLLLCLPGNRYHLIPRETLKSVDIQSGLRGSDYGTFGHIRFVITDDVQEEIEKKFGKVVFPSNYLQIPDSEVVGVIRNWISTGNLAKQKAS